MVGYIAGEGGGGGEAGAAVESEAGRADFVVGLLREYDVVDGGAGGEEAFLYGREGGAGTLPKAQLKQVFYFLCAARGLQIAE